MKGYVVYIEKSDPETVRTHKFSEITSLENGVLTLETDTGQRIHKMDGYTDFGIFPFGPENQQRP
jgi:uncharacterized membrane protein